MGETIQRIYLLTIVGLGLIELLDAACPSTCLNNTLDSEDISCNETTGECYFGCIDGFAGHQCQLQCTENCLNCSTSSAENDLDCIQCPPSYFKNGSNCQRCNQNCLENSSSELSICNQQNGKCTFGCKNGYYGAMCDNECNVNCRENSTYDHRVCDRQDGTCVFGCENGYYGLKCENKCSNNCLENSTVILPICDQANGTCTFGCTDRYHGQKCDRRCSMLCFHSMCYRDGRCSTGCTRHFNFYGDRCDRPCPNGCAYNSWSTCFQNGTCRYGCKTNFWGPTCNGCSETCVAASFKDKESCNSTDGFCLLGCVPGTYGTTCLNKCPGHCKEQLCHQLTGMCTKKCSKGYFGDYCNNTCSPSCPSIGEICFPENGTCIAHPCSSFWFGARCDRRCSSTCMNGKCNNLTGSCSQGCIVGYFGEFCDSVCLGGTYGVNCDTNCSQGCINSTCRSTDGQCECVEPYIGVRCNIIGVTAGYTHVDGLSQSDITLIGISILIGSTLIVIVTLIILCYKYREMFECFKPWMNERDGALFKTNELSEKTEIHGSQSAETRSDALSSSQNSYEALKPPHMADMSNNRISEHNYEVIKHTYSKQKEPSDLQDDQDIDTSYEDII